MYNKTEYDNLMTELAKTGQLLVPEARENLRYMLRYYTMDRDQAIKNHISNMIETYGEDVVFQIIRGIIEAAEC